MVDDGSFVPAGQSFAEVEVMKMYMTLQVPEAGTIHFAKLEGSVLEPGELIATVALEDPSKVHKVIMTSSALAECSRCGVCPNVCSNYTVCV